MRRKVPANTKVVLKPIAKWRKKSPRVDVFIRLEVGSTMTDFSSAQEIRLLDGMPHIILYFLGYSQDMLGVALNLGECAFSATGFNFGKPSFIQPSSKFSFFIQWLRG